MPKVEIVFIDEKNNLFQKYLSMPDNSSVKDAVALSGLYERYPECADMPLGVFGKNISATAIVKEGDRIEVYRALRIDPMKKRRLRAKAAKQK